MHGALATLGCAVLASCLMMTSAFVIPGRSKIVSGRPTRASTSQVILMGRGDMRTEKGKRKRHSFGKCRPKKKKKPVYYEGKLVVPLPAVARTWDSIEYVESEVYPDGAPSATEEIRVRTEARRAANAAAMLIEEEETNFAARVEALSKDASEDASEEDASEEDASEEDASEEDASEEETLEVEALEEDASEDASEEEASEEDASEEEAEEKAEEEGEEESAVEESESAE